ncbi:unnamed protein product [Cylindrotheca closterium]|uniref:Integrase catalytic domain-containing protein n=1 Tax=Cylindrotheca closterium TaxID=2856 RepID=A0AAD2GDU7_9STRA|nr:unnamed protein product [Cylindrotheca closterium]
MKSNLLCVDQLRDFGIIVNDVPLQRLKREDRNQYSHSIIDENSGLHIPMDFLKPISFFACRKPALSELDEYVSVEMTSSVPWEPYDPESVLCGTGLKSKAQDDFAPLNSNLNILGNKYVAVYAAACQWARGYALKKESEVSNSLKELFRDIGFPRVLRPDDAQSLTAGEFRRVANKAQVPIHPSEPYNPDQNLAEDCIREATKMYVRFMTRRGIPKAFWDRVFIYCLELRSHMVLGHSRQGDDCGAGWISGNTKDISHLADFGIYDWCWALSPTHSSQENKQLCRWLGPSFNIGGSLCFACATSRGKVLQRSSVIPLSREERDSTDIKDLKKCFTEDLHNCLKNSDPIKIDDLQDPSGAYESDEKYIRPLHTNANTPHFERYEDDEMLQHEELFEEAPSEEDDQVEFDKYVGVKIRKNENGIDKFGVVRGRKRRADGSMVGSYHEKPVLDTSIYEIKWHDGETESYRANEVIEAMMMNVDDDSNSILHNKKVPRRTTKGWYLCAQIHGDETERIDLKTAKEAYPIQVAEYAVANKLVSEPAFSWWVPYTLKKFDRILKAVKRRALTRKTEKFGLELPGTGPKGVRRAYEIDANTGSNHCGNAIEKEVKTVLPALRILGPNEPVPPGYTCIDLMTVFDVMMDLTQKARICAQGDQTDPTLSMRLKSTQWIWRMGSNSV